jgi:hypothetical protein
MIIPLPAFFLDIFLRQTSPSHWQSCWSACIRPSLSIFPFSPRFSWLPPCSAWPSTRLDPPHSPPRE